MNSTLFSQKISQSDISSAHDLIKNAQNITLLPHIKPDGDALGSVHGLALALQSIGKNTEIIYPSARADRTPFAITHRIDSHKQQPDLIISCDSASLERIYYPESFQKIPFISIDHHVSNSLVQDLSGKTKTHISLLAPDRSSTCEIITELLKIWDIQITTNIAQVLLFGIISDTQSFQTSNTSAQTLATASHLLSCGASLTEITQAQITHTEPSIIRFWGELLATSISIPEKNMVYTLCDQKFFDKHAKTEADLSGFINYFSRITQVDITLLIYQQDAETLKASLRSKETDVNKIAQKLSGGGHPRAAGISYTGTDLEDFLRVITREI